MVPPKFINFLLSLTSLFLFNAEFVRYFLLYAFSYIISKIVLPSEISVIVLTNGSQRLTIFSVYKNTLLPTFLVLRIFSFNLHIILSQILENGKRFQKFHSFFTHFLFCQVLIKFVKISCHCIFTFVKKEKKLLVSSLPIAKNYIVVFLYKITILLL